MSTERNNSPSQVLLVGPPRSGKTTFLAALNHVMEQADVPGALRLSRLGGDRTYLTSITASWHAYEEISRTQDAGLNELTMTLVSPEDDKSEIELVVPDLLGESYDRYLENREWPVWFDNFAITTKGILLFVHPLHIIQPKLILEVEQAVSSLIGDESDESGDTNAEEEWSVETMPTQVKLVELLQLLEHRQQDGLPPRVGLIVSAWDTVPDEFDSANLWLQKTMPLLRQYLDFRVSRGVSYRVFGVSAQGGDLTKDIEKIVNVERASDRITVLSEGSEGLDSRDITAPIRWLVQGE